MRKVKILSLLFLGILLFSVLGGPSGAVAAPMAKDPSQIIYTLKNKTNLNLQVTLLGEETYVVSAPPGNTKVTVTKGIYNLSYYACSELVSVTVRIKKTLTEYTIPSCSSSSSGSGSDSGGGSTSEKLVRFIITNKSNQELEVTLMGEQTYIKSVSPGKTKLEVAQGNYTLSYWACGELIIENIQVKKKGSEFKIQSCNKSSSSNTTGDSETPSGVKSIRFIINNRTNAELEVTMMGTESYVITARSGKTKVNVAKGSYTLSYWACGELIIENINVRKKNDEFKIKGCDEAGSSDSSTAAKGSLKYIIVNKTSKTLEVTLFGTEVYIVTAPPGQTRLNVAKDTYQFSYYDCGEIIMGTAKIKTDGSRLKITTCKAVHTD